MKDAFQSCAIESAALEARYGAPRVETKYLRLLEPVELGARIHGWRVCWLGGWDKGRLFYRVMVIRKCRS